MMEPELLENIETLLQSGDIDNIALALQIAKGLGCLPQLLQPRKELAELIAPAIAKEGYRCLLEAFAMDLDSEGEWADFEIYNMLYLKKLIRDIRDLHFARSVDARDKKIAALSPNWSCLKSLKALYLNNNQLTVLPEFFKGFSQLEVLTLNNNQLTAVPECIKNFSQLVVLNLSNNQLTTVPELFKGFSQLGVLALNNNQLTVVPKCIKIFSHLRVLMLNNNQLTTVPELFKSFSQLRVLELNNNQLTTMPEFVKNFSQLKVLALNNNQLTAVPEAFKNFSELEELYLSNNQIEELPEWLSELPNLKVLDISKNPLSINFEGYFEAFPSLECLLVEDLGCYEIPKNIVNNNRSISVTRLAENGSLIKMHGLQYYNSRVFGSCFYCFYDKYYNYHYYSQYDYRDFDILEEAHDYDWANDGFEKADLIEDSYYTSIKNPRKKWKGYLHKNKKCA
jgi:Leucine-rich repeat (LRR) protein